MSVQQKTGWSTDMFEDKWNVCVMMFCETPQEENRRNGFY